MSVCVCVCVCCRGGGAAEAASAPDAGPNTVGSSASERTGAAAACGSTTAPAVPGETQAALPAAPHQQGQTSVFSPCRDRRDGCNY